MIYKFKSKATGDLIMMGPNGDEVLRLIGKEPAAQGIVEPAAMAAAIAAIDAAVAAEDAARVAAGGDPEPADPDTAPRGGVSLRQRAWPMREMLKASLASDVPVVWGV